MCHYTHFTTEERELSRVLKAQGFNVRAIARTLNRSPSSVSREFRRNSKADGTYSAHHADKLYHARRKNCGRKPKLKDQALRNYVLAKLILRWTPEQISERAKLDKEPFSVSYPTIYRAIDSGVLPRQLKKAMRFKWKYKKHKPDERRGKIPDTVSIHERSKGAENRSRYGHWESDTVLGMRKTGCIVTHVERKSGFLVAAKIPDRQDSAFNNATINAFADIPDKLKKSFTVDNGKEFAAHKQLAAALGMKVYFCDPKEHGGDIAEYYETCKQVLELYPSGNIPKVENLEKHIKSLQEKRSQKDAEYRQADKKSRELSEATRTIEEYLRHEQSRDQQKKRKRNDLE